MNNPEKATVNEHVADGSKPASSSEANQVSEGKRSASDELRFQNALEDDEVRGALRVLRDRETIDRSRSRP